MTFYEKELHRLFEDSERISADTVFAGKTMITKIGEDLRAKVQFVNTKISGQYDALWFFGHYHFDARIAPNKVGLYNQIVQIKTIERQK